MSEQGKTDSPLLQYAVADAPRRHFLIWFMPLWCALIILIGLATPLRSRNEEMSWFAAFALAIDCAGLSHGRRDWIGLLICIATFIALLGVSIALPSLNRSGD